MPPPRLIRRLVLAPLVVVIGIALIVLFPLLALVALVSGLTGRLVRPGPQLLRGLRLLWIITVWLAGEIVALAVSLGLWITSGFGRRMYTEPYQRRTYATIRWFLALVYRATVRAFNVKIMIEEPPVTPRERRELSARPVIVFSRHGGPGDSFLILHYLLSVYKRHPRVVMKAALQVDPTLDVTANRVPNVFINRRDLAEHTSTEKIDRLARGLDQDGALLIFPEGGNWSPARWRHRIERLEQDGRADLASRAQHMPNLLAPQPGGVLAAIGARPDADVFFLAHAGLDGLITVRDVWRYLPPDPFIRARWWRVPFDQVPRSEKYEVQVKWLYDWWQRIDAWVTEHGPATEHRPATDGRAGPLADGSASAAAPS
jgi:1-acyl-sn-glycerol-3-phosphate acyltransferase